MAYFLSLINYKKKIWLIKFSKQYFHLRGYLIDEIAGVIVEKKAVKIYLS